MGNYLWKSNGGITANSMMIDDEGNIVIAGKRTFWGYYDLDSEVIIFKYDLDGNLLNRLYSKI